MVGDVEGSLVGGAVAVWDRPSRQAYKGMKIINVPIVGYLAKFGLVQL